MAIRDELQALFDRMVTACRAGDAAGRAALFTDDATLFSPYAPAATGRVAIAALHRDRTADGRWLIRFCSLTSDDPPLAGA